MSGDAIWKISGGPAFIRCKGVVLNLDEVVMICKFDRPQRVAPVMRSAIEIKLKSGSNHFIDFSQDDEACSAEPRDRAFEDLWLALKGKARQWAS